MKNTIILLTGVVLLSGCAFNLPSEDDRCIGQPIQGSETVIFTDKSQTGYAYCGNATFRYTEDDIENQLTILTTEFHREDINNNVGSVYLQITSKQAIGSVDVLKTPGYGYDIRITLDNKSISNFKVEQISVDRKAEALSGTIILTFNDVPSGTQQTTTNRLTLHLNNIKLNDE
jgi:hypothetical protein